MAHHRNGSQKRNLIHRSNILENPTARSCKSVCTSGPPISQELRTGVSRRSPRNRVTLSWRRDVIYPCTKDRDRTHFFTLRKSSNNSLISRGPIHRNISTIPSCRTGRSATLTYTRNWWSLLMWTKRAPTFQRYVSCLLGLVPHHQSPPPCKGCWDMDDLDGWDAEKVGASAG